MKTAFPKIYPITDPRISRLSHLEQVRRLIAGGARLIQVRDKTSGSGEFHRAAVEAVEYAHRHDTRIVINDRVDIALTAGADGVHIGQDDLSAERARSLLGPKAIIGYSTHSPDQAREALGMPIDYIAFGPVFTTATKRDHEPVTGLTALRAVRDLAADFHLVAIGGITLNTAPSVFASGADSVAVISELVSEPDRIVERTRTLIEMANNVGNG